MSEKDPVQAEIDTFIDHIKSGDLKGFQFKLNLNCELARARDGADISVILLAKYHKQDEMVAALVAASGPLDQFEAAATGDSRRLVRLLGEERGRLHRFSSDGFQILHLAAFFGHQALVGLLIDLGAHIHSQARNDIMVHPINCAAAAGAVTALKALLKAGADANAVQSGKLTVLMSAAGQGNEEMVEALVAAGAELDAKSNAGMTAANYAEERGHQALAAQLKEA